MEWDANLDSGGFSRSRSAALNTVTMWREFRCPDFAAIKAAREPQSSSTAVTRMTPPRCEGKGEGH